MTISLRLAWRNLWRHRRRTWLTTGAMIFSNVLLVFLITWQFAMYDLMINNSLRLLTGHFQIQHPEYLEKPRIENSFSISNNEFDTLVKSKGVVEISKRSEGFALVSSRERSYGMQIIGVEPEREKRLSNLPGLVSQGRYLNSNYNQAEIVIGSALAKNLKVTLGDELTLFGSARDGSSAAAIVTLAGIFNSGSKDLDRALGFIHLHEFDQIFSMRGDIHRLVALTKDLDTLNQTLQALPPPPAGTRLLDWNDLQPELKQVIQSDMASSWFMYVVLIVLVAFSVLNTQIMSVLERTKEYGIMLALGLNSWRLGYLVFLETVLMATMGLLIGVAIGTLIVSILGHTGFTFPGMEDMAAQFNIPATIHPSISFFSALLGPSLVFAASILAALYPVLRIRGLHIVEAMRAP